MHWTTGGLPPWHLLVATSTAQWALARALPGALVGRGAAQMGSPTGGGALVCPFKHQPEKEVRDFETLPVQISFRKFISAWWETPWLFWPCLGHLRAGVTWFLDSPGGCSFAGAWSFGGVGLFWYLPSSIFKQLFGASSNSAGGIRRLVFGKVLNMSSIGYCSFVAQWPFEPAGWGPKRAMCWGLAHFYLTRIELVRSQLIFSTGITRFDSTMRHGMLMNG